MNFETEVVYHSTDQLILLHYILKANQRHFIYTKGKWYEKQS